MKGCLGCLAAVVGVIVVLHVGSCVFTIGGSEFDRLKAWRNERLRRKAEEREKKKVEKIEAAKAAEAKRRELEAAAERERRQSEERAAARKRQEAKDEKIRSFALKEAAEVWCVYQSLKSEIDVQSNKISELRRTLETFGKSPDTDEDFKQICLMREEMIRSHAALRKCLEDAYLAKCKFDATPGRKDYGEQHRKALEDGVREAAAVADRFKAMRVNK